MRAPVIVAALLASGLTTLASHAAAQKLSEPAAIAQTVSGTRITVEYSRPVERGRRNVFGDLVKWGQLWTPGADWATTLDVDHDVRLEGKPLPKGKYSVWAVPNPDSWTLSFHRKARRFHLDRPDSTDEQLRVTVRPDTGAHTEVMTWDFPEIATGTTTLRFRWASVVVPLHIGVSPPPLGALGSHAEHARYLGSYDVEILLPGATGRHLRIELAEVGDTLHWRDVAGPVELRRDFVMVPAGEDQFVRARKLDDGQLWKDPGIIVTFNGADGRATGFEVEFEDGGLVSRGKRLP